MLIVLKFDSASCMCVDVDVHVCDALGSWGGGGGASGPDAIHS